MGSWKTSIAAAKKGCASNSCSCVKANLSCTSLCKCVDCSNRRDECNEFSDGEDDSESEEDSDSE